jgi:hypothetical protein
MGSKRNSISYNSGKLPIYNDASAAVGGEISVSSSLANQLVIHDLLAAGILFRTNGTSRIRISPDDHLQFTASSGFGVIAPDTVDGADNKIMQVAGGGTGATGRGGYLSVYGNEAAGHPGSLLAILGTTVGSFKILGNSATVVRHEFTNAGDIILSGNSASGGDALIRFLTSDSADTGRLRLCGGGSNAVGRGSWISVSGNESGDLGGIYMETGNSVSAVSGVTVNIGAAANNYRIQFAGSTALTIGSANWSATPQQRPAGSTTTYAFGALSGLVYPNITSSGTNYNKVVEIYGNDSPISVSATDSGYRVGLAIQNFFNLSTFAGTLQDCYGAWVRAGTDTANPTGTINNVVALFAEVRRGANTPFGNSYGIYQISTETATKNFFQNSIGISASGPFTPVGSLEIKNIPSGGDSHIRITDSTNTPTIKLVNSSIVGDFRASSSKVEIGSVSSTGVNFLVGNTARWEIRSDFHIAPSVDSAYSLGVSGLQLAEVWVSSLRSQVVKFQNTNNGDIYQNTADAADNKRVRIGGGGDVANTRGGFIEILGNESTQYDGAGGGQIVLRAGNTATGYIRFETGGSNRWQIDPTNGYLLGMATEKLIGANTSSGSDNARVIITGAGGIDGLRGATISMYGNNYASSEGTLNLSAGSNATNSFIALNTLGSERWRITPAGVLQFANAAAQINANTSDGSDTSALYLVGGGGLGLTRGAQVALFGNEASGQTGNLYLDSGNATSANVYVRAMGTGGVIYLGTNGGTARMTVNQDGTITRKAHSAYTNSGTDQVTAATNTTDATTANLYTKTLLDNTTYKFTVDITGRFNSTTAKGVWGKLEFCVYRNNAGGATLGGTRLKIIDTYGSSGYDFDVDVTSNDVRVRITGATSETVSWTADIKSIAVSTAS